METYNGKGIRLYYPQVLESDVDNNILTLTTPGQPRSLNSLLRWSGTTELIQISTIMFDNGVNKAVGGTAVTINEQIVWLKDTVNRPYSESSWTIDGGEWSSESVILHGFKISRETDDPNIAECKLKVEVGTPA